MAVVTSGEGGGTSNFLVIFIIAQLQLLTLLFMTVVFEAFAKITSRHPALVLLFSKELATHILEFYNTFILIVFDLMRLPKPPGFLLPMAYMSAYLYFINYIHVLALAINRFYAVFWPKKYGTLWTRQRTVYISIGVWIIGMGLGSHQVVFGNLESNVQPSANYQISMFDVVQFTVITVSLCAYIAILAKLAYEKWSPKVLTETAEIAQKDRMMLCAVFFASLIPMPLNHALYISQNKMQSDLLILLHYTNGTLLQALDELLLFLLCKEFRDRVKVQMVHQRAKLAKWFCRKTPNSVGPMAAASAQQQQSQQRTPVEVLGNGNGNNFGDGNNLHHNGRLA